MADLQSARESSDQTILRCIEAWRVQYPHEVDAIRAKVSQIRSTQKRFSTVENKKGMGRKVLHKAEIPMSLYSMISLAIGKEWTRDRRLVNFFLRNFRIGCVNRTSEIKV